jgi:CheY-like chemotaxis protein
MRTVSVNLEDIRRSYELGAVAHISKPAEANKVRLQAQAIRRFFDQA